MSATGRNTIYNLAGLGIPLLLFVVTIPFYIHLIGAARYGVLSIVWLVLGLFGMLDLGLGRAATQKIASLKDGSAADRCAALGTALVGNVAIGGAGALIMLSAAYYIFAYGMKLEPWLRTEALSVVPLMAIGVPVVTSIGILAGALQGREKFFATNRIAITNAALFQLLPLGVAWLFGPRLWPLVLAALCARFFAVVALWLECRREFGGVSLRHWRREDMVAMLRYGGWVTGAAIIGIVLVFSDRFIIGAMLGAVAVTVYAVPFDGTRRIAIIADAVANAMFPRFAVTDAEKADELTARAIAALYFVSTPLVGGIIIVADPLFRMWLGDDLGSQSAPLAQILAIAAWANIFAKPASSRLQAQGRPKSVTLALLIQLPFYVTGLWWAISRFGLTGAAWAFLARNAADMIILNWLASRKLPCMALLVVTFSALALLVFVARNLAPQDSGTNAILAATFASASAIIGWMNLPPQIRGNVVAIVTRLVR